MRERIHIQRAIASPRVARMPGDAPAAQLSPGGDATLVSGDRTFDNALTNPSPGRPLDRDAGQFLGAQFGHSFANVHVHADSESDQMARTVDAAAFTTGRDIFFREGTYDPGSRAGMHLLAHETAHVIQQGEGPVAGTPIGDGVAVSDPADPYEQAADLAAHNLLAGRPPALQRRGALSAPLASAPSEARGADSAMPTIQRFGSDEHKKLGDEASGGATLDLDIGDPSMPFSYGDMVALAGDYFESIEQIKSFATPANPDGQAQLRWARWDKLHTGVPGPISEETKTAVRNRFYALSAKNATHFSGGGTAHNEYARVHTQALGVAFEAGASGNAAKWPEAMATEAFSNHYLTDMFSAGHVRTPRTEMQAWYTEKYPDSIPRIITYITDRLTASLKGYGDIPWYWPDDSVKKKVRAKVEALGGDALAAYTLGDIVSLAFHNRDSEGLNVISDVDPSGKEVPGGYAWTALGDDRLKDSPITQQMAEAAVKASLQDLSMVREAGMQAGAGKCLPPEQMEAALRPAIAAVEPFHAEKYVPREGKGNISMEWKWGGLDPVLREAVDKTMKGEITGILRGKSPADMVLDWQGNEDPTGSNHLHIGKAYTELCDHIAAEGVGVLEAAMKVPARYPEGTQGAMDAGISGPPAPPSSAPVPTPAAAH